MLHLVAWSDDFAQLVSVAAGEDLPVIARQVQQGIAQAWVVDGGDIGGGIVTRLEVDESGRELVLVLGEGFGLRQVWPYVEALMSYYDADTARTHVKRPGMVKMWQSVGFEVRETVLSYGREKQIKH